MRGRVYIAHVPSQRDDADMSRLEVGDILQVFGYENSTEALRGGHVILANSKKKPGVYRLKASGVGDPNVAIERIC
jgi:hypothetical protein